jgi:phi13 family phage major tail protein
MSTATENKVQYGLKNAHYAVVTYTDDTPTYGTPVAIPGSVSLSLKHSGDIEKFYADDGDFYDMNNNNGYSGDLEIANVPDQFLIDCLGYTLDATSKALIENADAQICRFALMFEFNGDKKAKRHVLYQCTASRPDIEGKTNSEKTTIQTAKLSISVSKRPDGVVKFSSTADTPTATYDAWYTKVQEPTPVTPAP